MAQTRKRRRRKHSGTQAGTVERRGGPAKAQTREERREAARRRRAERLDRPPTLRDSVSRAAIAALIFAALVIFAFGRNLAQGLTLGVLMFLFYIPIGYLTDLFIYRRRQRKRQPPAARGSAGKAGGES